MSPRPLAAIPLIDIRTGGPINLLDAVPEAAEALRAIGERHYTRLGLRFGDAIGRAWLERTGNPYRQEIAALAARLRAPGGIALNLSYEYACTGLAGPDPRGAGARLLRVLDWKLPGLGRHVAVARQQGVAGEYYNVTWPGASAVLTAMAPGRFGAAIHQAPMRRHGLTLAGDWLRNRGLFWRSRALPPAHLLRQVFDECPDYSTARRRLSETPIALPAIFILTGIGPGETCIVERLEDRAAIHDGPASWANAWQTTAFGSNWRPRGHDNPGRCAALHARLDQPAQGFGWLQPPVLNRDTKLALCMNAATAELTALGIEMERPATLEFSLKDNGLAAA
jgi:hypothetical protein